MDADDLKNIKNDLKCSDVVRDLEALGYVTVTYDEKGEEWITITKKGLEYYDMESKKHNVFSR